VVIEALSAGTAVLVSEAVGLASYVKTNELGWACGTSAEEISTKLHEVYFSEEKLAAIRQSAPAIIRRDFSPAVLTEKYLQYYKADNKTGAAQRTYQVTIQN
jgi:glycosyltransferase involved in cell wall biosynthesis